jgi:hypothetical protein
MRIRPHQVARFSRVDDRTAHCSSLISHSRFAVSLSCASGLGGFCCWSKKYAPLTFATSGEVRLARSTRDLLNVIAAIAERGAGFKSLKDAWADTTSAHGRLMLTVLGGLAEFERELIRARTGEGRKRAKERGVRFGRPRKMTPHQRQEALQRRALIRCVRPRARRG